MTPMNERQRLTIMATGYVQRGFTEAETIAAIRGRFSFVSEQGARDAYRAALGAMGAAVGASLLPSGSTVGEATGVPAGEDRTMQVEALVTITRPGAAAEHRTIRITASSDDSLNDVRGRIQEMVDDWAEAYDVEGRMSSWDLRYIL